MANNYLKKQERKPVNVAPYIIWPLVLIIATLTGLFLYVYSKRNIARIVGDFPITERMIGLELKNFERMNYKPQPNATPSEMKEFESNARTKALTNLTDFFVVLQKAKDEGKFEATGEDIQKRIDEVVSYSGLTTVQEYLAEAQESEAEFREQVRNQLIYEKITNPIRENIPEPTEMDIQQYFQMAGEAYNIPETVDYEQIVVPDQKTLEKAIEELAKSDKGKNFAEVAKKYSTDIASRDRGGKMLFMTAQDIAELEIRNAIFPPQKNFPALEIGIIQPVETQKSGIYIVRVIKKNPPQIAKLDGKVTVYNRYTSKYEDIQIKPQIVDAWKVDRGNGAVSIFVKNQSDHYESLIYDRTKGNMPWAGLEKFFAGLLGESLWNRIMGVE